nr:unnamed protein product [Spirometra erinaceieuropaei]
MQYSVLGPTLFGLMFSTMLMNAYQDERPAIRFAYGADGQPPNHFQSHVSTTTNHELLFVDDCTPNSTSEGEMQRSVDPFAAVCEKFGLIINTEKTSVMRQSPPDAVHNIPQFSVKGAQPQAVDNIA